MCLTSAGFLLVAELVFIMDCPIWIYSLFILFIIPAKTTNTMQAEGNCFKMDCTKGYKIKSHGVDGNPKRVIHGNC